LNSNDYTLECKLFGDASLEASIFCIDSPPQVEGAATTINLVNSLAKCGVCNGLVIMSAIWSLEQRNRMCILLEVTRSRTK
jgi:hypothetical protein